MFGVTSPNTETFTVFVTLPSQEVCSIRRLVSGLTIHHLRCRLELLAGLPAQTYRLLGPHGQHYHDNHVLVLNGSVWDGILFRVQLTEVWAPVYDAVMHGDITAVSRSKSVSMTDTTDKDNVDHDVTNINDVITERNDVTLFLASWMGETRICQELLATGVDPNGQTLFARTPVFAAAYKDHEKVLECLVGYGASLSAKDTRGDTVIDIARGNLSRRCSNKIRELQLAKRGLITTQYEYNSLQDATLGGSDGRATPVPFDRPRTMASPFRHTVHRDKTRLLLSADSPRLTGAELYSQSRRNSVVVTPGGSAQPFRPDTAGQHGQGVRFRVVMPPVNSASSPMSPRPLDAVRGVSPRRDCRLVALNTSMAVPQGILWHGSHVMAPSGRVPNPEPSQRPPTAESSPGVGDDEVDTEMADGRSVESDPHFPTTGNSDKRNSPSRKHSYVSRYKQSERRNTANRRIQLAEQQKQVSHKSQMKKRETFEEWLKRKKTSERQNLSFSDTDDNSDDNDGEKNSEAFNEWLKELRLRPTNEENPKSAAHLHRKKSRAIKGLIVIEKTKSDKENEESPDTSAYMNSMNEWREKQKKSSGNSEKRINTANEAKKALEDRRQQLLAKAITYNEWMEHTEDRTKLTKLILNADQKQLDGFEKMSNHRKKEVTFQQWRETADDRYRKQKDEMIRMRREKEEEKQMMNAYRYGPSHEDWLSSQSPRHTSASTSQQQKLQQTKSNSSREMSVNDTGFNSWVNRKHKLEKEKVEANIRKEKQLLLELRERRQTVVA